MLKCFLWQPLRTGITNQWHQHLTAWVKIPEDSFPSQYLSCDIEILFNATETIWFRPIVVSFFLIGKNPKPTNQIKQYTLVKSNGGLFKILITQGSWPSPLAGVRYRAVQICPMADYQCLQQPHYLRTFSCNLLMILQIFFLART